jgi:transketolase
MEKASLLSLSKRVRLRILEMALQSSEGHVPSSFSIVEILISIWSYCNHFDDASNLTRVVLSKGHATYAWYALLRELGLFSPQDFDSVGKVGSKFYGHLPFIPGDPRFSFGSGSLGHGLPFAIGLALGDTLKDDKRPTFVIVGDGEANEGTFWESLLLLSKFRESTGLNLKLLIDSNESSERAIPIRSKLLKLGSAFDLNFCEVDGHDHAILFSTLIDSGNESSVIICSTKKGFPLPELSHPKWHHSAINRITFDRLASELYAAN